MCRSLSIAVVLLSCSLCAGFVSAAQLDFDDRVDAEAAIVRLQQSWRSGKDPAEVEPVPRKLIEQRVRTYLKQSVAVKRFWDVSIDVPMLEAELQRIVRDTHDPERLRELFAALDHDPVLIQECIARPLIARRRLQGLFDGRDLGSWWRSVEGQLDPRDDSIVVRRTRASALPQVREGSAVCSPVEGWLPMSAISQPGDRNGHTVIWTGAEVVVWGGNVSSGQTDTGGIYSLVFDSWDATSLNGAPSPRSSHTAVWTGSEMIVWGGQSNFDSYKNDGARWDPVINTWQYVAPSGGPGPRSHHAAVWTGDEMIVTGGTLPFSEGDTYAYQYSPDSDTWSQLPWWNHSDRQFHTAVWTGSKMIVWGGRREASTGGGEFSSVTTGYVYDPATLSWTPIAPSGLWGRAWHSAVWTGSQMIIWGGAISDFDGSQYSFPDDGAVYDPAQLWTYLPATGASIPRDDPAAVWAGGEMVVIPTFGFGDARYNPSTDQWTPIAGAPDVLTPTSAVWTGHRVVVWDDDGAIYAFPRADPDGDDVCGTDDNCPNTSNFDQIDQDQDGVGDACDSCPADPANDEDADGVCGDVDNCDVVANPGQENVDGDSLGDACDSCPADPAPDPDLDAVCSADNCPTVSNSDQLDTDVDFVGDACDNCPSTPNPGQADGDSDAVGDACDLNDSVIFVSALDATLISWQQETGFNQWNLYKGDLAVLRTTGEYTQLPGSNPLAAQACDLAQFSSFWIDSNPIDPNDAAFFLVSGNAAGVEGTLGTDSDGAQRTNANACP